LKEAIDIFENSSWIREILGEDFCRIYVESKKKEWLRYTRQVTDWEVEEYLYRL
jgi:glutamine synthetase